MSTLDKYTEAHFKIALTGFSMPEYSDDSNLKTLFEVSGKALLDAQNSADTNLDDLLPDMSGNYLEDWERVLGLPIAGLEDLTTIQRLGMVKAWLNIGQYSNAAFLIKMAKIVGYDIAITEFTPSDPPPSPAIASDAYLYFQVDLMVATPIYFRVGTSRINERLVSYSNDALETLIKFFKPAHSIVLFNYSNFYFASGSVDDLWASGSGDDYWAWRK